MLITKSEFLIFLEAPLHLWAIKHDQVPDQERDEYMEHLAEQGYEVEEWAMKYLHQSLVPEYKATKEDIMIQPTVITEHFKARADILIRKPGTDVWDIYEVKSSTKVKEEYCCDATFQNLVFEEKYKIGDTYLLHVNRDYVRQGDIDVSQFLKVEKITDKVTELKPRVKTLMAEALRVAGLASNSGVKGCLTPKFCICPGLCHPDLPDYSIFDVNRLPLDKKEQLLADEIRSVHHIPKDFPLSKAQRLQVDVAQSGETYIKQDKIVSELASLQYPLCFIDYEAFKPAVPLHDGYGPYHNIPFQYSLHVVKSAGAKPVHYEFFHAEKTDPVPDFLASLKKHLPKTGSIIVWNKGFEGGVNNQMAELYPKYKVFCFGMNRRLYDLAVIFQKQWHAHPGFKGSYSIKNVLPALVPDLSYEALEVAGGTTAMAVWKQLVFDPHLDEQERAKLKDDMLRYCGMDSLAMVKIWEVLMQIQEP